MEKKRKPRLLWASTNCLIDSSSGASMTVRQMLKQLVKNGYEVHVLGATIFDSNKGTSEIRKIIPDLFSYTHTCVVVKDSLLNHDVLVTRSIARKDLTSHEEVQWYKQYVYMLDSFKPDVVMFYGGLTLDMLIADEARDRGIATAFYLANGNYKAARWCRDVDIILTDSKATSEMYKKEVGFSSVPLGKFIDPVGFVSELHERKRLLFVNPSWQKGASVFIQIADKLEQERPDIELEVVEARADWSAVVEAVTKKMGKPRKTFRNVFVTKNTDDMRGPYSRARIVIAPSLWWESSGRVLAEAMLNGIPAIVSNRGGMPEMIKTAGIVFDFPPDIYQEPYQGLLNESELQSLCEIIKKFYDDEFLYQEYVERAWKVGDEEHSIVNSTARLTSALGEFVRAKPGNKDFSFIQKKRHKHRLSTTASKPDLVVDNDNKQKKSVKDGINKIEFSSFSITEFDWELSGQVIVLDNRASLIQSGLAEQMEKTGAFGIVAFDPASEVKDVKRFEGSKHIQVFQHALLGDGKPATLHACVAPEMTSILAPLPAESLPKRHQLNAQLIAELPINSIALDSINGLDSLDWLILDELSDAMGILEHGKKSLTGTLLIQVRVPFQLTHEKQPSLAELQQWSNQNGFRFYRLHNISHHSYLPESLNDRVNCATEQESADVLFLPSNKRIKLLSDENKTKLAFVLSSIFNAHDIAFDLLVDVSKEKAMKFLESLGLLPKISVDKKLSLPTVEELVKKISIAPLSAVKANHTLKGHLIVSLTSYKARFDNLHLTLRSLLLQKTLPDMLILWIAEDEKDDLPENVWELEKYGLIIRFCEDIRSYKKIIPTLREFPDSFIVTADDDIYYESGWLTGLVNSWDGGRDTIVAHRAHKVKLGKKGKPIPYQQWKWEVGPDESVDGLIFPTGCGGVLYPPFVFHKDITDKEKFMELCPDADDLWLYWMASLNGAKAVKSDHAFNIIEWPSITKKSALWEKNISQGGNDIAVKKLTARYGFPRIKDELGPIKRKLGAAAIFYGVDNKYYECPGLSISMSQIDRMSVNVLCEKIEKASYYNELREPLELSFISRDANAIYLSGECDVIHVFNILSAKNHKCIVIVKYLFDGKAKKSLREIIAEASGLGFEQLSTIYIERKDNLDSVRMRLRFSEQAEEILIAFHNEKM